METHAYKVVINHTNEISRWTILYKILRAHAPNLGGMSGDVQYDLSTLELKKG